MHTISRRELLLLLQQEDGGRRDGTLAGYGTNNMLVPATGHAITLLSNTPQNEDWKPADTSIEMYNAAALGPKLPPLLKRVRTTLPH